MDTQFPSTESSVAEHQQDDEDRRQTEEITSLVPLSKRCGACNNKKYHTIMNILKDLQSQTKWPEHRQLTTAFLKEISKKDTMNTDMTVVLTLEQGTEELMQKNFSVAKKLYHNALKLGKKCVNMLLLQGRALMFLGNAYRKQGPCKYGKAFKYLMLAQQNLSLVESGEDKAELNYLLGSFYLNMLSMSGHRPPKHSYDRIEKCYDAVYECALLDPATRVHEKVKRIFPVGMANFLLDCNTEVSRARVIPESKLKRAEDCLNYFSTHFELEQQPINMQTAYLKAKSDLEFRQGHCSRSKVSG